MRLLDLARDAQVVLSEEPPQLLLTPQGACDPNGCTNMAGDGSKFHVCTFTVAALASVVVRGEEGGGDSDWAGRRRLMREGCGAERALVARGGEGGAGVAIGPGGGG